MNQLPINLTRWCLPRRTVICYNQYWVEHCRRCRLPLDPDDVFRGYRCLDCQFYTPDAQVMVTHQTTWHGWRNVWRRIIDG